MSQAPEPFLPLGMSFPPTPKTSVPEVTFAFLDTETTGMSPQAGARVCEIAVVTAQGGKVLSRLQSLINPGRPIPPDAQRIHGISDAMVAASPTFAQIAPKLIQILDGTALVCHNASFDLAFLAAEFKTAGLKPPDLMVLDTLTLARRNFRFASNSLGAIARSLGIEPTGWHRAGNDVEMLRRIFDRFAAELAPKGARTLGDLMKLAGSAS